MLIVLRGHKFGRSGGFDLSFVTCPSTDYVVCGKSGSAFFNSFAHEVYQLVKLANTPRRLQCHRFISKHHILWAAVKFTKYRASINALVKDLGLRDLVEVPAARRPPYGIYLSARDIADYRWKKLVRVEHIVVAVVYERCKVGKHKLLLKEFIKWACVRKFLLAVEDSRERSRGSSILLKLDAETVRDKKEGKTATQNCFHHLESEILSMTVNAISLAISQLAIVQELAVTVKEEDKVPTQPASDMVLVEENSGKIVTRQPESHQGDAVKHAVPKIAMISSEDRECRKMTRHEANLLILENFLQVNRGGYEGVFFSTSFPSEEREVEERVKKMATRLAMVSLREWMLSGVEGLGKQGWGDCGAFEEKAFKRVAKLILDVYDKLDKEHTSNIVANLITKREQNTCLSIHWRRWVIFLISALCFFLQEDFERFNSRDKLLSEYKKFYDENLFHLKSDENPYKLVAKGKIRFDRFPLLREQDVGYLLKNYSYQGADGTAQNEYIGSVPLMSFGFYLFSSCCFEEGCHDRFVEMARTVLLQYINLKEDIKIHSILDCLLCRCGSTLEGLLHDVCHDFGIQVSKEHQLDKLTWTAYRDLSRMTEERLRMLRRCSSLPAAAFVRYGPSDTLFSSFGEEVCCLVQIADARRRFQSHRFISKYHIHWAAVRFTIYKELIDNLVEDLDMRILDEPARRPPYSVYMSARAMADCHGAKLVGVEHVVVAIAYEMCEVGRVQQLGVCK
ncbi:hypothetical protein PTKIN_Ptkin01aG0329500 [Pterospermum kingtungense]